MRAYRGLVIVVAMATVAAAGCGKSEEQKAAEQVAEATKQLAQAATQTANTAAAQGMAQGANAMAQGAAAMANAMAGTTADGKPIPVVDFEKLIDLFPNIPGWEKGKPTGSTSTMMGNMSLAEVNYQKGDEQVRLHITDAALARMVMMPLLVFTNGYNERSTEGYKKSTTIAGFPGYEEWRTDSKRADITAIVANRFVVQANGSSLASVDSAKGILAAVDLAKLAGLK